MAAARLRDFAAGRAEQALGCFGRGEWAAGLAKARAALELLERQEEALPPCLAPALGGACLALAAQGEHGGALALWCRYAEVIADERLKEQLLQFWHQDCNAPRPGDLVQLSGSGGAQLVCEAASPLPAPGEELDAGEEDMTLLTARLSAEQRRHWGELVEERPGLFGQRMRSDNEARWRRLFGAAARRGGAGVGAGACAAEEDAGLPLEQTFVATLHGLVAELLPGARALTVDLLGCRPALELESPDAALVALMQALPAGLEQLTVRMCGPEVNSDDCLRSHDIGGGRRLHLELRRGLYHDAWPEADADLVVAMNAGVGVPQYATMWGPTLDLLARRPRRGLLALTSYTSGELLREESLLRARWAEVVALADAPCLAQALAPLVAAGPPPWTLPRAAAAARASDGRALALRRGDAVLPGGEALRCSGSRMPEAPGRKL
ncbi:unnamed protein product [Prorocentrum cordatum]|uniref:Mitochondrial splicing suppressor 51-like C-terminal domain-containing protein n=1 Tax=Prorocentrum cordatum TaxID=2364126 RepID=A0ABN9W9G7_9DINO|nr:unnamed protein product [Polarella glacialis]